MKCWYAMFPLLCCGQVLAVDDSETTAYVDWQSHYVSEGRNNLPKGGITWTGIDHSDSHWLWYERQGFGDATNFVEFNAGFMYQFQLPADFAFATGYKRLEFFGDVRCSDNELSAEFSYDGLSWLTPNLVYTWASEAAGAFVEFSLTANWQLSDKWLLSPYLLQGWDLGFASLHHNGRNNFQFGITAAYDIATQLSLALQLSRSLGQDDIEQQAKEENCIDDSNQTFGGIAISYRF